jgi:hypothetical protein
VGEYLEKMKELPKDSDEYAITLRKIETSLTNMFKVNPGLDWIEQNLPLLQNFVNGVDGAYDEVARIMSEFYLQQSSLHSDVKT